MVELELRHLEVPPGQRVIFQDVSWQEFEAILKELGEHRATRLAYGGGRLEIRMPLPEDEKAKVILGDLVKILLEELQIDGECFGSTTFKREDRAQGIEPDDSFYIQNQARMIGKERLDLSIDPPPDLAIEVDVTSRTQLSAYEALEVAELWRYGHRRLQISVLQDGKYFESDFSPTFAKLPIIEIISQYVEQSRTLGRSSEHFGSG
jgi:Uma2 family endonuclease